MFQYTAFQPSAFASEPLIPRTAFQPGAFQLTGFQWVPSKAPAFQYDAFQSTAFQSLKPSGAQPSATGGWSAYNDAELRRLLRRRIKRQEDEERLEDALEALQARPAVDPKASELKRLQSLVSAYARTTERDLLAHRTQRALDFALRSQTGLAYELALREIAKQLEEEEHAILLTLAML